MVHRTRRGSCGPNHARLTDGPTAAPLTLLLLLTAAAWFVPDGMQAQETVPPIKPPLAGPQTGVGSQPSPPPPVNDPGSQAPQPGPDLAPQPIPPAAGLEIEGPRAGPPRFQFAIDPKTPLKDLLPTPPKGKTTTHRGPVEDLAAVPELDFQAALAKDVAPEEAARHTAQMLAQINFLNGKKTDGFLQALRDERTDLDGLPFAMGEKCRTKGERSRQFAVAVATVRQAMQTAAGAQEPSTGLPVGDRSRAEAFWEQYKAACFQADRGASQIDRTRQEDVALTRVAALLQVLAPEGPDLRLGLIKYLAAVPHADATRALGRLAIFSAEEEVRQAAVEALQVRRERDYTDVLVKGLHYPLPAVARRSAEAVAKLQRTDLVPQLVALLDEPDPRAPATEEIDKKPTLVVRELVRVNHHRNCLLCHSPGNGASVSQEALKAPVPLPTEALGSPVNGYQSSTPELLVRIDVTYLRQDFSLLQPVEDANPWPEMQRFDFLVRTRVVTEDEAADYRKELDKRERGRPSSYQRAALLALRELTGKEAEPTAAAWRRVLETPDEPK